MQKHIKKTISILLLIASAIFLSFMTISCRNSTSSISINDVRKNYINIAYANYSETLADAISLQQAIEAFTNNSTAANFTLAKAAWIKARESYGQSEAFRFAGGPIDKGDLSPEGRLNAWPLDESHIDYVFGDDESGLINDPNFILSESAILGKNTEGDDERKISTGYHAIEFLLWGQDLSVGAGAGQRHVTDYTTRSNSKRRKEYLFHVGNILVKDLSYLVAEWANNGNYRKQLLALNQKEFLQNLLTSIGKMAKGELGAERIGAALISQDKEDEHSCFSDNTHRDTYLNAKGVLNVYLGEYTDANGQKIGDQKKSVYNYLLPKNSQLAGDLKILLEKVVSKTDELSELAIKGYPFDQIIKSNDANRKTLEAVKKDLFIIGEKIVELGKSLLNVTLSTSI